MNPPEKLTIQQSRFQSGFFETKLEKLNVAEAQKNEQLVKDTNSKTKR